MPIRRFRIGVAALLAATGLSACGLSVPTAASGSGSTDTSPSTQPAGAGPSGPQTPGTAPPATAAGGSGHAVPGGATAGGRPLITVTCAVHGTPGCAASAGPGQIPKGQVQVEVVNKLASAVIVTFSSTSVVAGGDQVAAGATVTTAINCPTGGAYTVSVHMSGAPVATSGGSFTVS